MEEQPDGSKSDAWAGGGSIAYEWGWLPDRVTVGAELFTSQKLCRPLDRDWTGLLEPGQRGYTVLGQAYGKLNLSEDHMISAYR